MTTPTRCWMRFGLADFVALAPALACHDCESVGQLVVSAPHPANGGVRPICSECGSVSPLPNVLWLSRRLPPLPQNVIAELAQLLRGGARA